ncbi:MAG: isoprenylcysteine carboxylmethyltransferase family protein [Motiliproteus sp.]
MHLKIPPVIQLLIAVVLIYLLNRWMPLVRLTVPASETLGSATIVTGFLIAAAGIYQFRRAGTTVDPRHPEKSQQLVNSGIYRYTRNPMYLGMLLVLAGDWCWFSSVSALAPLPVFVGFITHYQIKPEEAALAAHYGQQYNHYQLQVRRWL